MVKKKKVAKQNGLQLSSLIRLTVVAGFSLSRLTCLRCVSPLLVQSGSVGKVGRAERGCFVLRLCSRFFYN